jgi:Fungal Zn(2)-Cys(6) binuclear cluster domain
MTIDQQQRGTYQNNHRERQNDIGRMADIGRACDGCRIRKRKCDMLLPVCTNCKKSQARYPFLTAVTFMLM